MILIYRFECANVSFLVAARGAAQARQRAIAESGHKEVTRQGAGEKSGLDSRYVIACYSKSPHVVNKYQVTFCGQNVGFAESSMKALALAVAHERNRWRSLPDAHLMRFTVDQINAETKAGRASWADAHRYAELWNLHKLSSSATVVGGVVCVVDGAP